ncbi:AMP-binding protein [Oxalobacteraceae bacterium]|nr:AMP-binding protein [Oxalobacteraceae bacterium]
MTTTSSPARNDVRNFNRALQTQIEQHPEKQVLRFLNAQSEVGHALRYADLDGKARSIAAHLLAHARPGDRVMLLFPNGAEFISAFIGCLYAGMIAVPVYAFDQQRLQKSLPLLVNVLRDSGAAVLLAPDELVQQLRQPLAAQPELASSVRLAALETALAAAPLAQIADPEASQIAFLQYTSGSTGRPKGVMVSHGNLVDNETRIAAAFGINQDSRGVFWLPHYHDMGLIGGLLQPLYSGFESTFISPAHFAKDPLSWLETISACQANLSGAPNFAYEICARDPSEERVQRLELAQWSTAFCGAEPIRAQTLQRFSDRFAPRGFKARAFLPCYGLAEATLFVTGRFGDVSQIARDIDPEALRQGVAQASAPGAAPYRAVSSGHIGAPGEVVIVDPDTLTQRADGQVGEILVCTPSVAQGYWQNEEATRAIFQAKVAGLDGAYLRTGDLGFVLEGELFVSGRRKELIILNGRNYYPQDIEATVLERAGALKPASCAAFGIERDGAEQLVIALAVRRTDVGAEEGQAILAEVATAVGASHGVPVARLLLVPPRAIGKTTSGKLQRAACRGQYLNGTLELLLSWPSQDSGLPGAAEQPLAAPATPVERWLHGACCKLLQREAIGMHASLLELGVNSIELAQLASAIEGRFGFAPKIDEVFAQPTLHALAAGIDTRLQLAVATMPEQQLRELLLALDAA